MSGDTIAVIIFFAIFLGIMFYFYRKDEKEKIERESLIQRFLFLKKTK